MTEKKNEKLELWQERLAEANSSSAKEVEKMDSRERLYNGQRDLKPLVRGDTRKDGGIKKTSHVRNIVFENIESQVSTAIPQPKVTPKRREDEHLAEVIERFLRAELDRLPFEMINDMAERTVLLQGGAGYLVEWDNTVRGHDTVGAVTVSLLHPKQFAPQPGVYTGIEDMDWFIIKLPTTKNAVWRKYRKRVFDESESEPDVRRTDGGGTHDDAVTQYIGYERSASGGINRYSWCGDVELEDISNYQARRQPVCRKCGRVKPLHGQVISNHVIPTMTDDAERAAQQHAAGRGLAEWFAQRFAGGDAERGGLTEDDLTGSHRFLPKAKTTSLTPDGVKEASQGESDGGGALLEALPLDSGAAPEPQRYDGGACPWCGAEEWTSEEQEFEQVLIPIRTAAGKEIPGMHPDIGENGEPVMSPTLIPFYKPDMYPVILQRSVSVYGQLLGNSDVDVIADQQNTVNRLEQKIIDRLIKAGTRVTLPDNANLRMDPEDGERWFLSSPSDKAMIDVYQFAGDLQYELMYLANVYEEARQMLGITDSFQGRRDTTATSGKAKEFSAAQSAGRLESKRVMKNAAYAALFEMMFKFWLAYSDEPRAVSWQNFRGEMEYEEFNRYDFLEQSSDGSWWWNDQFMFSCDTREPLASNREAMWQETRMNLQTGAFGDPTATDTLILFWTKMEELHYPGAAATLTYLKERQEKEMPAQLPPELEMRAREQAMRDAADGAGGVPSGGV